MTDNAKRDMGSVQVATGRSQRIIELVDQGIKSGKKFTAQDMVDIQQDMTDIIAREMMVHIEITITNVLSSW